MFSRGWNSLTDEERNALISAATEEEIKDAEVFQDSEEIKNFFEKNKDDDNDDDFDGNNTSNGSAMTVV